MTSKFFSISLCLLAALFVTACNNGKKQESSQMADDSCFIHYTSDTLDEVTAKARQRVVAENNVAAAIDKKKMGALSYEQYAMLHPTFSAENEVDSLMSSRGFKTMVIERKTEDYDCIVLYIHGGAFTYNLDPVHRDFCEALLKKLNAKILMPLYPLAPNYTVSDTFEMLLSLYKELLKEGKPIYIMGDSAGGNITLCFTGYLHTQGLTMPKAIMPISPAVDYTMSNPELWKVNKRDIVLGAQLLKDMTTIWADKGMGPHDPKINALDIDLEGFPPTLFYTGTDESFYPDVMKMHEKLKKAGIRTGVLVGRHLWHVSADSNIPVRDQFIGEIIKFIE